MRAFGRLLLGQPDRRCDTWIPAARPDIVDDDNVHKMDTRLVVDSANIPLSRGAEKYIYDMNMICVQNVIANAGGVPCAAMEYKGMGETAKKSNPSLKKILLTKPSNKYINICLCVCGNAVEFHITCQNDVFTDEQNAKQVVQ